ncbi:hypothetical protein ACJRW5_21930 [Pseudomonas sp. SH1-B]
METVIDLYNAVRERFPDICEAADSVHAKTWGETSSASAYSWFESLANALNNRMNKGLNASGYMKVFSFLSQAVQTCGPEIRNCIDVAFVENLFWKVPGDKAEPYWEKLPASLKELYVGFHNREPL